MVNVATTNVVNPSGGIETADAVDADLKVPESENEAADADLRVPESESEAADADVKVPELEGDESDVEAGVRFTRKVQNPFEAMAGRSCRT